MFITKNPFLSLLTLSLIYHSTTQEKLNLDTLNNYSEFLNFGEKKPRKPQKNTLENEIFKSKLDTLGEIFKTNIDSLKLQGNLDIVFLVDASSSVGETNFKSEIKFVKKLLSDVTVDYNHTRVSIVTFSSPSNIVKNIDEISKPSKINNKCMLLNDELININYTGGETYTLGAFKAAKRIFEQSRKDSKKVLFLITDGYSNGGDPVPLAHELKNQKITIFTIGIQNGNFKELYEVSSEPGEFYSFLLDSYEEFEGLARRALHVDLKGGDYIPLGYNLPCDSLCPQGNCCDKNALCSCGTTSGHYSCICKLGFHGSGLRNNCFPCIPGTYSEGPNLCLPCPDINHTTKPPAVGIASCKCKLGYQPSKNNQCKILKCPKILTPNNGYLVKKKDCGNVLNSACGIRCEVGYTLVGQSIRLCQGNATWSGTEPSCEVKTCSKLTAPKYGQISCFHADLGVKYHEEPNFPVDTTCTFSCSKGRTLIGSKQRTCLPLAQWDGLKTSCKQIKCNKIPTIKYGNLEPKSCTTGKQDFGKNCSITCEKNFQRIGPSQKTCQEHGLWNPKFQETFCLDLTEPNLTCPKNLTGSTFYGMNFGLVSWLEPKPSDNSGSNVTLWMEPFLNGTSHNFTMGLTRITYFAQDQFRNQANCSFYVLIKDLQVPTIEDCVSPDIFLTTNQKGANVSWDEPNIFDNSRNVTIVRSHEFGWFPLGTTTVTYTALDQSKNKNVCRLNITIEETHCEVLPNPTFGQTSCNSGNQSVQCVITCLEGYAIPLSQSQGEDNAIFNCQNSDWFNSDGLITPECSVTQMPIETQKEGTIQLDFTCDKNISDVTNDLQAVLQKNLCKGNCNITTQPEPIDCSPEMHEEQTNSIAKRSYEVVPHRNHPKRLRKKLNLKFQVKGQLYDNTTNLQFRNSTILRQSTKFLCPIGFIPRKNRCVQCPKGTFHNSYRNKCQSCPFDTFNDKLGQNGCFACPRHHATRKMHSKRMSDCREKCPPGTFARKKPIKNRHTNGTLERPTLKPHCRSCSIGYYQPNHGQLQCVPCAQGQTTRSFTSKSVTDCIPNPNLNNPCSSKFNPCKNNGTCNYHGALYSCKCQPNYIGSNCEQFTSKCDSNPCLNGAHCKVNSSNLEGFSCACVAPYSGRLCAEVNDCQINCQNNGHCVQSDNQTFCLCPANYYGQFCEQKLLFCHENLCQNNGKCLEDTNTFHCICQNGFMGRRCNILPCDYKPCEENHFCVNLPEVNATKSSFRCDCLEGLTGDRCQEKIDFCTSNLCQNGGVCFSNLTGYTCQCPVLFGGKNCETKRPTNYLLYFPKYDTSDYVQMPGFQTNLTEVTSCFWMQTLDNFNYGTMLSYATRQYDNAFTLTDYTGLVFYVNNQYIVTDLLLNDGLWHHLCVKWQSKQGLYSIVVDGNLVKNGSNLATNSTIQGNGDLIVGQEQDVIGGQFSQSESFTGSMAYVDVWQRALSIDEMQKHFHDCEGNIFGDLYAWPELHDFVRGQVKIIYETPFCKECPTPKELLDGFVEIFDHVAYYSCNEGYRISDSRYENGRRCLKPAIWEGVQEPLCQKIYCGYPGYIENGYIIGRDYYFSGQIQADCYEDFILIGNKTIFCTSRGVWHPNLPTCLAIQCKGFAPPKNSNITLENGDSYKVNDSYEIGQQILIECSENLSQTLTCQANGTWNDSPIICPTKSNLACSIETIPSPPSNGFVDNDSLMAVKNGTSNQVTFKCNDPFKLRGENTSTCIIDGYWTVPNITCQLATCNTPPNIKNMIRKSGDQTIGSTILYECISGYKMFGSKTIRCLPNLRWTRLKGRCTKKSCPKPKVSDQTLVTGNSYLFEDEIVLLCTNNRQYSLICNDLGNWEGEMDSSC